MNDRRSFEDVDAALDEARRQAAGARLPAALRARILAAARPAGTPARRGRLADFALRAAAVAAAIAAVLFVMSPSLEAAEFDAGPLVELNRRVADHLPRLDFDAAGFEDAARDSAVPLAAAAVLLVGAGLVLVRRGAAK